MTRTDKQTVLVLIHGIRTIAWWQGPVSTIMCNEAKALPIPIKYGYFDLLRFLCPFSVCRRGPIERIRKEFSQVAKQYKGHRLIVLAHSYGTYALTRALLENPDFKLDRLLLCGSIVPKDFPWNRIQDQIKAKKKREAIINECGTRDIWPVLASSVTWGYGSTGTDGFGTIAIRDRMHEVGHSEYFQESFVREFWVPIVQGKEPKFSIADEQGAKSPGWFLLLRFPYKWVFAAMLFMLVSSFVWGSATGSLGKWACNATATVGIAACNGVEADTIRIESTGVPKSAPTPPAGVTAQEGVAAGGDIKVKGDITIRSSDGKK